MNRRRNFLKLLLAGIFSFFIYAWNELTFRYIKSNKGKNKIIPIKRGKDVLFEDEYIIASKDNTTVVYSSHCTHLGCKIDQVERGHLVCPCHGSEYDLSGKVLKGPAFKSLKKVAFSFSENGRYITIKS